MTDISDEEAAASWRRLRATLDDPNVRSVTFTKYHDGPHSARMTRFEAMVRGHARVFGTSDKVLTPEGAVELLAAQMQEGSHV